MDAARLTGGLYHRQFILASQKFVERGCGHDNLRQRQAALSTFLRVLKWLAVLTATALALAIVAGVVYQSAGAARDADLYPSTGVMVPVGDARLHLTCEGAGEPTVVLDALSGGSSVEWAWIQPELARVTRTCSYDRAGRPWSDPHPAGDLWETAETLHQLLAAANVAGPYVLAGHSIGGLYVRAFQARYPNEVAGLALIDSSQADQFERYPELAQQDEVIKRLLWTFPWMARVGLFRLFFARGGNIDFQDLPPAAHDEMAAQWSTPQFFESLIDENSLAEKIFAQARDLGSLGDLPLAVVTAEKQPAVWSTIQNELAALSTRSTHVTVEGAMHSSLALDPEHARQTAAAIVELVQRVRSGP